MNMPSNMPINGAVSANLSARVFKSRTTLEVRGRAIHSCLHTVSTTMTCMCVCVCVCVQVDEKSWNLTPEQRAEQQRIKDIK